MHFFKDKKKPNKEDTASPLQSPKCVSHDQNSKGPESTNEGEKDAFVYINFIKRSPNSSITFP